MITLKPSLISNLMIAARGARLLAVLASLLLPGLAADGQTCPAPKTWFPHSQTPPPDPNIFSASADDCDFYHWAWQEFLYVTQEAGGAPRFLGYPSDADLLPTNPFARPLAMAQIRSRPAPMLKLRVRGAKPKGASAAEDIDSFIQASGPGGVLIDEDGRPLFYSVNFNPTFYSFVESNRYYDYKVYTNADPNTVFPPGSLELKASWKIVTDSSLPGFRTPALVPTLFTNAQGQLEANSKKLRQVIVELVGLHVVGVVTNHPEFIWATFEQVANAPNLPPGVSPTSDTPVSASNFTFYKANTPASQCNLPLTNFVLDSRSQTISPPTQVFRQYVAGGGSQDNLLAIATLNTSVQNQMKASDPADPWNNYAVAGGVWLLPGALHPNMTPSGTDLHGSTNVINATMETFAQEYQGFPSSCFTCHNTTSPFDQPTNYPIPALNMNLSHILTDIVTEQAMRKARALAR
jgi:hypothetical protein